MSIIWGSLAGIFLYLELVYHVSGFGWSFYNPIYTIMLILAWSGAQTMLVGVVKGRWKQILYYGFIWFAVIWHCVQLVYLRIFKLPLLWEAIFKGGGDALTNYWREALEGVLGALPFLVLFMLPATVLGIVLRKKKWEFPQFTNLQIMRTAVVLVAGVVGSVATMEVGKAVKADYYEEYQEFYNPISVAETMGVLPMLQRDTILSLARLVGIETSYGEPMDTELVLPDDIYAGNSISPDERDEPEQGKASGEAGAESGSSEPGSEKGDSPVIEEPELIIEPQQFDLDYEALHALADNKKQTWLADYIQASKPTNTNEYTGMFEGYNLIFLTAEGFSPYVVSEELTPTLYKLTHSGFVFENYYTPLWQTSTSDGEYINCTGLIPDGQFSMRKSGANNMAYTLAKFFAGENVYSYAYHNNSLDYYDRHISHPNLGYDFKCSKLGGLSAEEWGSHIFTMDNPDKWPASDLEMMQGTVQEYINNERFHVYYLTVSGHMNYNFRGNSMASKNRDAVAHLEMSENARAYLACNIELDKALEYLIEQLEAAGKLENTVICLGADHYPYGMTMEQYEELAGKSLSEGKDLFRNNLILWNAGMEETVYVDKACGAMDIVPTLLNLFGFDYDSRMYAGKDILSDAEGMVIFNDRSFVTDAVIYDKKEKEAIWLKDTEGNDIISDENKEAYLEAKQQEVKNRYQFSAYILQENYYQDVEDARVK